MKPSNVVPFFLPHRRKRGDSRTHRNQLVVYVLSELIDYAERCELHGVVEPLTNAIEAVIDASHGQALSRARQE